MCVKSYRLMCLALLSCPDLRTVIETAGEFGQTMMGDERGLQLTVAGEDATLSLDIGLRGRTVGDMLVIMFGLAAYRRLFDWLIHDKLPLLEFMLAFPANLEQPEFNSLFRINPTFEHPISAIRLPKAYLDRPVHRTYHDLQVLLELFPFDALGPDYGSQTLTERIRVITVAALSRNEAPPGLPRLAAMLGLSIPTLQRRLAAEDNSLMAIRNECRRELVTRMLSETQMTIKEIAFNAQFADSASLRRAFRAWTGTSPSAYREARHRLS